VPYNTGGYDEIPTNFLKISSVNIRSPLNHTCNTSLLWGIFSLHLEYYVVKPLHKRGWEKLLF
jgi:hypothetical protein